RAKELFKALIPLRIYWTAQGTLNVAQDRELVRLAYQSGCKMFMAGLESISEDCLDSVGKRMNKIPDFKRNLKVFEEEGISVMALMIFGFDVDDQDAFKKTRDFLIANRVDYTLWHPLVPFPKTAVYERMNKSGRLKSQKWWLEKSLASNFWKFKFNYLNYPEEEFFRQFIRYYRSFYSPVNILRRIALPPKKRLLGKLMMNLFFGSRISHGGSILEN
ncbi:MAG: hypothetical protein V1830_04130, partial [Candidatus Omnitrophota bacterium]